MTRSGQSIRLTDEEINATKDVLARAIEPHSCAEGTPWRPAYTAWRKLAIASGLLEEDED